MKLSARNDTEKAKDGIVRKECRDKERLPRQSLTLLSRNDEILKQVQNDKEVRNDKEKEHNNLLKNIQKNKFFSPLCIIIYKGRSLCCNPGS
jgi:hypothetical protein